MTLLITVFAAVLSTAIWYKNAPESQMKTGILCLIYWGASLMWSVDLVMEFLEIGSECFYPEPAEMLNDTYLGLSAVALGLVIWIVTLLIKDPKKVFKTLLQRKRGM